MAATRIAEDRSLTSPSATERDALEAVRSWATAVIELATDPEVVASTRGVLEAPPASSR